MLSLVYPDVSGRQATYEGFVLSNSPVGYWPLQADTLTHARNLLVDELTQFVAAGGIEMPGGVENWNYDTNSVSITIKKFYNTPILNNL